MANLIYKIKKIKNSANPNLDGKVYAKAVYTETGGESGGETGGTEQNP
ncbi:MAG: hypothetical protein IJL29_06925 [Prevotella sp.]|nr:hypothetical protein [Prevotella sp.]